MFLKNLCEYLLWRMFFVEFYRELDCLFFNKKPWFLLKKPLTAQLNRYFHDFNPFSRLATGTRYTATPVSIGTAPWSLLIQEEPHSWVVCCVCAENLDWFFCRRSWSISKKIIQILAHTQRSAAWGFFLRRKKQIPNQRQLYVQNWGIATRHLAPGNNKCRCRLSSQGLTSSVA